VEALVNIVVWIGTSVTLVVVKVVGTNVALPDTAVAMEEVVVKTVVELLKRVVTWPAKTANGATSDVGAGLRTMTAQLAK